MARIKVLSDLQTIKKVAYDKMTTRIKGNAIGLPQIRVVMATSGIVSGAKEIFDYILEQADLKGLDVVVTQTGSIAKGNAQPVVVEVALSNQKVLVFENVDKKKVNEILNAIKI
ncbi:MAG: (2Fe-2S) ferredoxin domain-containing protein [Bacteroidales bacterium]